MSEKIGSMSMVLLRGHLEAAGVTEEQITALGRDLEEKAALPSIQNGEAHIVFFVLVVPVQKAETAREASPTCLSGQPFCHEPSHSVGGGPAIADAPLQDGPFHRS